MKIVSFENNIFSIKGKILLDLNFESLNDVIINTSYYFKGKIFVPLSNYKNGIINIYNSNFLQANKLSHKIINAGYILGIASFSDKDKGINYILVSNKEGIFTYDLNYYYIYYKFIPPKKEKDNQEILFNEACITRKDDQVILIGTSFNHGYFYFWDFDNKKLINITKMDCDISNICLWDNNYIFASFYNSKSEFGLINLKDMTIEEIKIENDKNEKLGKGRCVKLLKRESNYNYLISISFNGELNLYKIIKQ